MRPSTRWMILAVVLMAATATIPVAAASFADPTSNDGNTFASREPIRVTTYRVTSGVFTGTTYDLTLANPLASDYFVILRGGAGNNTGSGTVAPDSNSARVTADPHGYYGATTGGSVLRLGRVGTQNSWQGQVTVVESLDSQSTTGFRLRGVAEVFFDDPNGTTLPGTAPASASGSVSSWMDICQVGLYGGPYGGGVSTEANNSRDHVAAWGRVWPSGSGTVNVQRFALNTSSGGYLNGDTTFSVYAVEWGSEWSIYRAVVSGSNGGNGINSTGEYTTTAITDCGGSPTSVTRANTFVIGFGHTNDNGLGDGWAGHVFTLGDGVAQNTTESVVAVGAEYPDQRDADVYVHEHPRLAVDYRFGSDGAISSGGLNGTQTVDAASGPETYVGGGVERTSGYRMAIVSNSSNGTGNAFPRPMAWARHEGDTTVRWSRSRSGQPGAYWLQSVDFASLWQ